MNFYRLIFGGYCVVHLPTNFAKLIGLTKLFSENRQNTLSLHPQPDMCEFGERAEILQMFYKNASLGI